MVKNTSYQRIIDTLEHREPDRVPFDLGAAAVTGINIRALRNLKKYLGIPSIASLRKEPHLDGNYYRLSDEFGIGWQMPVEAGVDILNPFQVNCRGMDTAKFKREFGKDLTIWGGSCDSQHILPKGTPQEVRDETKRCIDDLAPGGGFVFAPIHVIQGDVPPENIMAWWEALNEYRK
ncbi:MAG: hypothetical protein D4R64_13960 [Porphyromonadaceae bacterium]|nr:MAG: hypothetical protein D4R64_13960 [Porphyromonadaceae bacterium]